MAITSLPKTVIKAEKGNPKFLIYYGRPKSGKSTIASQLEDNLIIDLEKGYRFIDAMKVEVNTFEELLDVIKLVDAENKAIGKCRYKYITIDNGSKLEELLLPYALMLYQKTPMGKKYTGPILDLEHGGGYRFTRMAMQNIIQKFKDLCDTLILICHTKDNAVNREGREMSEMEMALTGSLPRIIGADADSIAFMYRKKNQNFLNFNGGGDQIVESRQEHLRGKEILIAESDENGKITTHWDKIFLKEQD